MHSKPDSLDQGEKLLLRAIAWHAANFVENSGANLQRSEAAAVNALRTNPDSSEGLIAVGGGYSEEGREAEAIRTLRKLVAVAPNNQTACQLLGYAHYYAGLDELAEKMYRHLSGRN